MDATMAVWGEATKLLQLADEGVVEWIWNCGLRAWNEVAILSNSRFWHLYHSVTHQKKLLNFPRKNNELLFAFLLLVKNVFVIYGMRNLFPPDMTLGPFLIVLTISTTDPHTYAEALRELNWYVMCFCLWSTTRWKTWWRYIICLSVFCGGPIFLGPTYANYLYAQDIFFACYFASEVFLTCFKNPSGAWFNLFLLLHLCIARERAPTVPEVLYVYMLILLFSLYIKFKPGQQEWVIVDQTYVILNWMFLFSHVYLSSITMHGFSDSSHWMKITEIIINTRTEPIPSLLS